MIWDSRRLHGISPKVFEYKTERGTSLKVLVSRSYIEDDQWHDTPFLGHDDLPLVRQVADEAYKFVIDRQYGQPSVQEAVEDNTVEE